MEARHEYDMKLRDAAAAELAAEVAAAQALVTAERERRCVGRQGALHVLFCVGQSAIGQDAARARKFTYTVYLLILGSEREAAAHLEERASQLAAQRESLELQHQVYIDHHRLESNPTTY